MWIDTFPLSEVKDSSPDGHYRGFSWERNLEPSKADHWHEERWNRVHAFIPQATAQDKPEPLTSLTCGCHTHLCVAYSPCLSANPSAKWVPSRPESAPSETGPKVAGEWVLFNFAGETKACLQAFTPGDASRSLQRSSWFFFKTII